MSSSGNPNANESEVAADPRTSRVTEAEAAASTPQEPLLRRRMMLLVGGVVLVASLVIGVQLVAIIYGLVFPPEAPLPPDVVQLEHDNLAYGVDEWVYGTPFTACSVVAFFTQEGGTCTITPGQCGTPGTVPQGQSTQNVATCRAVVHFSIFTMEWETTIAGGYRSELQTRFTLRREVFWVGGPSAWMTRPLLLR